MNQTKKTTVVVLLLVAAAALLGISLVSNSRIEQSLLGDHARSLGWGTTLFRSLLAFHGGLVVLGAITWWKSVAVQESMRHDQPTDFGYTSKRSWIILALLSVVALGLRLWHLNSDLWYDELISLLDVFRPSFGQIVTSFPSQNQHMFYSVLAHSSIEVFGESAWAVRLPAVAFGLASLWALFLLGRRLVGTTEALLACALMTVSYHHIWFSQNARGYMGLLFFSILATWFFLEGLRTDRWRVWLGYALAIALGHWLHMTMAFVFASHGFLYVGWLFFPRVLGASQMRSAAAEHPFRMRLSLKPLVAAVLAVSLTIQLHALSLPEFLSYALHQESKPSEWSSAFWVVTEALRSLNVGLVGLAIVFGGLVLFAGGWIGILRRNPLAALAMVLPAVLGGTTMLVLEHYLWPRFFFFSLGFGIVIAIHGAMTVPSIILGLRWPSGRSVLSGQPRIIHLLSEHSGVVITSVLLVASMFTLIRLYTFPKQDFTGARDWVERTRKPEDRVVAVGLAGVAYGRYFAPQWSVAQTGAELDSVRSGQSQVWLVYTLPIQMKAYHADIWSAIEKEFETVEVFPGTLGGGGIYVCRQRTSLARTSSGEPQTSMRNSK